MSELLKKSEANFSAAVLLITNGIYAPCVHCSYYACFQKLKNVIATAYNCDYDDLKLEHDQLNNERGKRIGSHEFFIDYKLLKLIRRNGDDHRLLNEINEIKYFRAKSDYDNIAIVKDEAELVKKNSEIIIKKLNNLL